MRSIKRIDGPSGLVPGRQCLVHTDHPDAEWQLLHTNEQCELCWSDDFSGRGGSVPIDYHKDVVLMLPKITPILPAPLDASQYTSCNDDPIAAGNILADEWCRQRTEWVDLWGLDYAGQEFLEVFLERCEQRGLLLETTKIKWVLHQAPPLPDEPTLADDFQKWIGEFIARRNK